MEALLLSGLKQTQVSLINNWIAPIFFIMIAGYGLWLLKEKKIREAALFGIIALIVGVFIFFGEDLFGKTGTLTSAGKKLTDTVKNTIDLKNMFGL